MHVLRSQWQWWWLIVLLLHSKSEAQLSIVMWLDIRMGSRAMRNIAVLDLTNAVELISMLEGLHFGTTCEVTRVVEWIKCISTGRRMQSQRNVQVDFIFVLFWSEKLDSNLAFLVTVPVPNWWTSWMFLGVVYSLILLKNDLHTGVKVSMVKWYRDTNNKWSCCEIFHGLHREITSRLQFGHSWAASCQRQNKNSEIF